ncbi:Helix-turn-helix domain protein [Paraliobacillus sp. PM-2]|uniref:helix-turn-helix domain-containing protein n=1 Tax=Paraliobacillus sp. PM-2 TaxID=1462524 RepID=UPI00061CC918|nr:helix-turn-helix domain-containing protein [Paraliobacillus sp. PM-2]CQR46419.1 Helix-turn-helix domain protein [Paraliobacillus sp. PM-2]
MDQLGHKIKHYRKKLGLSQHALSYNICDQSVISRIENNEFIPSSYILLKLSQKLMVDIEYLLGENTTLTYNYIKEVKDQLDIARRNRDYDAIYDLVRIEENNTLFNSGENKKYLMWHKGIVQYHKLQNAELAINTLKTNLSSEVNNSLYSELDINILNSLGIMYRFDKDLENAKKYIKQAIDIVSRNDEDLINPRIELKLFYNYAKVLTDLNQANDSNKVCLKGINKCKKNETLFLFGEFHYQFGRNCIILGRDDGIEYWEQAHSIFNLQGFKKLAEKTKMEIDHYKAKGEL